MSAVAPHRAQHSAEGARIPASPYTPKERALIRAELYDIETCMDEYVLRVLIDVILAQRKILDELSRDQLLNGLRRAWPFLSQSPLKGGTP
jgi:hypothetical protein